MIRLPSEVGGPIVVVVEHNGKRVPLRMSPLGTPDNRFWCGRWPLMLSDVDAAPDSGRVDVWFGRTRTPLQVIDWWPADGVALPEPSGPEILVCYADGVERRVARLWPGKGRRSRPQWIGFGGDIVDNVSAWGACAEPGGSVIVVSHREREGWGRRHTVLGWAHAGPASLTGHDLASKWRVEPDAIRAALA